MYLCGACWVFNKESRLHATTIFREKRATSRQLQWINCQVDYGGPNTWVHPKSLQRRAAYSLSIGNRPTHQNGRFLTISSRFSATYINIFHYIEVQMIILRCCTGLNLKWFKSYDTKWAVTNKGQLISEWIYEDKTSPKKETKNCKDFCPVSFLGEVLSSKIHSENYWPLSPTLLYDYSS